eukprot:scaffold2.g7003.t1
MASRFWRRYLAGSPLVRDILDKAAFFAKAGGAVYIIRENLVEFTVCVGPSMYPTFNPRGDVALLEHVSVWSDRIKVGDVVVAKSMQNPRHVVCKRVLGLAGDAVTIPSSSKYGMGRTVVVPKGHVWLQGDNFNNSTDSRQYGPVPYAMLRGRVFLKVWPLWEAGWVENRLPDWMPSTRDRELQRILQRREEMPLMDSAPPHSDRRPPIPAAPSTGPKAPPSPPAAPAAGARPAAPGRQTASLAIVLAWALVATALLLDSGRCAASQVRASIRAGHADASALLPGGERARSSSGGGDTGGAGERPPAGRRHSRSGGLLEGPPLPEVLAAQARTDLSRWNASGITLRHVEQAYCSSKFFGCRIQRVGGRMYVAGLTDGFESRLLAINRLFFKMSVLFPDLPDFDLVLEQDDWPTATPVTPECPERGPLLHHVWTPSPDHAHVVRIPDWSFLDWPEAGMLMYPEMHGYLLRTAAAVPWDALVPRLFFRGNPWTSGDARLWGARARAEGRNDPPRPPARAARRPCLPRPLPLPLGPPISFLQQVEELELLFSGRTPMADHCRYKYLLHMPGRSNSGRFKYLFGCGSVVVWHQFQPYAEWWFPLLENGTNVIELPIDRAAPAEQLHQLVGRLKANDTAARALGRGALRLFSEGLHPRNVYLYIYQVLSGYARLMTFQPTVHPDAVPMEQVLAQMAKVTKPHSARTCTICRRPAPPAQGAAQQQKDQQQDQQQMGHSQQQQQGQQDKIMRH